MAPGLPDAAVKESKDRVSTALANSGYKFPMGKTTINLAPADVRKEGSLDDVRRTMDAVLEGMSLQRSVIRRRHQGPGITGDARRILEITQANIRRAVKAGVTVTFAPPSGARFDRVVSVEMFEHMRNWEALLARVRDWLTPDGALFVHVFCMRDAVYPFEVDGRSDWMARYFFTGGLMPSETLLADCATGFRLEERWRVNGSHYARTSRAWLANQDAARATLMPILAATYGAADAARWFQRWRIFHMACAELFDHGTGEDWFVTHARLRPRTDA